MSGSGWWSNIVADMFTHSATFYPRARAVSVHAARLRVAWKTAWFLALTDAAIAINVIGAAA
jgi:hypothetical protein